MSITLGGENIYLLTNNVSKEMKMICQKQIALWDAEPLQMAFRASVIPPC